MDRRTGKGTARGAIIVLGLAGGVFSGVSCRGTDIAQPTEPSTAAELHPTLATTPSALSFRQVSAGFNHTCGVTTENRAYCWGRNKRGQLGDGTTTTRLTPVAVAGGLPFRQVSTAFSHTCGVTTENRAYCWGNGGSGRLGDGTALDRLAPVAVAGGLPFRQISAAYGHTCAVTTNDRAYCWGLNRDGRLGDGTTTRRLT
ncbi:MAG TPA: hypothetical protein VFZ87_10820, partial [Gemmatimonadales bacterium]